MSSLSELEEDRERSLAALMALDREWEAGEIDEVSYRELRDDYAAQAAAAIRALEPAPEPGLATGPDPALPESGPASEPVESGPAARGPESAPASQPEPGLPGLPGPPVWDLVLAEPATDRPRGVRVRRRWMLGGAVLAFAIAAGIVVGNFAVARQPGEEITGNPPVTATSATTELSAQVAAELLQARTLVSENSDVAAAKILTQVLDADPTQPVALAYQGWVLRLAGVSAHSPADIAHGRALVAEATALDPTYPDAHVFLGYMYYQDSHNASEAVTQFKSFLADHPLPALVQRTAPVMAQAFAADHQPVPATVAADVKAKS